MYTLHEHKCFHTKACVFTAPNAHSNTSLSYTCVSTQPADKTVEHLMNSFKLLLLILEKKTEAINVHLISNSKREGGKRHLHK